jgi:hypothetical protein
MAFLKESVDEGGPRDPEAWIIVRRITVGDTCREGFDCCQARRQHINGGRSRDGEERPHFCDDFPCDAGIAFAYELGITNGPIETLYVIGQHDA